MRADRGDASAPLAATCSNYQRENAEHALHEKKEEKKDQRWCSLRFDRALLLI